MADGNNLYTKAKFLFAMGKRNEREGREEGKYTSPIISQKTEIQHEKVYGCICSGKKLAFDDCYHRQERYGKERE